MDEDWGKDMAGDPEVKARGIAWKDAAWEASGTGAGPM